MVRVLGRPGLRPTSLIWNRESPVTVIMELVGAGVDRSEEKKIIDVASITLRRRFVYMLLV